MISQKVVSTTDTSELLVLGSGSIARKELLESIGLFPDKIESPCVNECIKPNENAQSYVKRIAVEKAKAISLDDKSYLITADTVVLAGRQVLLKTSHEKVAQNHLRLLSGRRHTVFTAFCVRHNGLLSINLVKTSLKMKILTEEEIKAYIASREWVGCAGAYGIQGRAKAFFPFVSGCVSNVIGLPLPKLTGVLKGMGFPQSRYEKRNNH